MNAEFHNTPSKRIRDTLDTFSRRHPPSNRAKLDWLPETFRNRVTMLYQELTPHNYQDFWNAVRHMARMQKGDPEFPPKTPISQIVDAPQLDMEQYLKTCSTENYFDVLELSFQATQMAQIPFLNNSNNQVVEALNEIFSTDGLPFQMSQMVQRHQGIQTSGASLHNISEYPKVILAEDMFIHDTAVNPALVTLEAPDLSPANENFRQALSHYRHGMYEDSIQCCSNALESTLKIISKRLGLGTADSATLSKLIDSYRSVSSLPTACTEIMKQIAAARNQMGTAHGRSSDPPRPRRHVANFILAATAGAITLIVEESTTQR